MMSELSRRRRRPDWRSTCYRGLSGRRLFLRAYPGRWPWLRDDAPLALTFGPKGLHSLAQPSGLGSSANYTRRPERARYACPAIEIEVDTGMVLTQSRTYFSSNAT